VTVGCPVKFAIVLLAGARLFLAASFSARVVDNLGNPVVGARIAANCNEYGPDGSYRRTRGLFAFKSGPNGIVSGTFKQPKSGCEKSLHLRVKGDGYGASNYDAFRPSYVLRRNVKIDELDRIVQLAETI